VIRNYCDGGEFDGGVGRRSRGAEEVGYSRGKVSLTYLVLNEEQI